jgi:hypothetical protein
MLSRSYRAYSEWALRAGEGPLTKTALGIALGERGFQSRHTSTGQAWQGLRLRLATEDVPPPETDEPTTAPPETPDWVTTPGEAANDAGGADDAH